MSDNESHLQQGSGGDLRATVSNNKALSSLLAVLLTAALGAPLTIYAKADDVEAVRLDVESLRAEVTELKEQVRQAARTGTDLRDRFDKIFPAFQKMTDESRIEKEVQKRLAERLNKKGHKE